MALATLLVTWLGAYLACKTHMVLATLSSHAMIGVKSSSIPTSTVSRQSWIVELGFHEYFRRDRQDLVLGEVYQRQEELPDRGTEFVLRRVGYHQHRQEVILLNSTLSTVVGNALAVPERDEIASTLPGKVRPNGSHPHEGAPCGIAVASWMPELG
jgi:hypothetical protein